MKRTQSDFKILNMDDYKNDKFFTDLKVSRQRQVQEFTDAVNEHLRNGWIVVNVSDGGDQEGYQIVALVKETWTD